MNKKYIWIIFGVLLIISLTFFLSDNFRANRGPSTDTLPYGTATLTMNEEGKFPHVSITPLRVTEDSRCAEGTQCVWAGTVKVNLQVLRASGNYTQEVELGKSMDTGTEMIELVTVSPGKKVNEEIRPEDYRFTFHVAENPIVAENPGKGGCYVGGCSGQICSDDPGAVSTCEFRAEYACYKDAVCERQSTGECGWTETLELSMCLDNPPAL